MEDLQRLLTGPTGHSTDPLMGTLPSLTLEALLAVRCRAQLLLPKVGCPTEAKLRLDDDSASLSSPEGQETPVKIGAGAAVAAVANGIAHERRVVVDRMSEFGDHASLIEAEEDISHEQLQMIKARTMFQLTKEIADDSGG